MKRVITALLLISIALECGAQNQKIDPTVEVNREYQGKMMEITKSKLSTRAADSIGMFNLDFNYSIFERPYKDMYEFSAVPSASIPKEPQVRMPSFVAKAGIGYPFAPEAAVWYNPKLLGNNWIDLHSWGSWFNGDVPTVAISDGTAVRSGNKKGDKEYSYGVSGKYTHAWKGAELSVYGKFNGGYNTYYSGIADAQENQGYHNFNVAEGGIDAKSSGAGNNGKRMNWHLSGVVRHTSDKGPAKFNENYAAGAVELGPVFGRYNKFMVRVDAQAVQYSGNVSNHMGIFGITPQYRYENGNLRINLGIKVEGKFSGDKNKDENHSWIFPAVDLSFRLAPGKLWVYGTVDGWNSINTYSSLLEKNRFINPAYTPQGLQESSVPLHAEGGFKGRFTDKFTYRLYAAYTRHKGLMQFIYNCNGGWFGADAGSTHNEVGAGGEIDVSTGDFRAGVGVKYSLFSKGPLGEEATGIPALQGDIELGYNWNGKIFAGLGCHLQGEYNFMYTGTGSPSQAGFHKSMRATAPAFADLNATVSYVHSDMLSFWLRGDNLLNSAIQYNPFHIDRGTGILAGIIVKL